MAPNKQLTLLLIHQGGKLLLGMKKRGFGAGKVSESASRLWLAAVGWDRRWQGRLRPPARTGEQC
jgi:hypothetical protein